MPQLSTTHIFTSFFNRVFFQNTLQHLPSSHPKTFYHPVILKFFSISLHPLMQILRGTQLLFCPFISIIVQSLFTNLMIMVYGFLIKLNFYIFERQKSDLEFNFNFHDSNLICLNLDNICFMAAKSYFVIFNFY